MSDLIDRRAAIDALKQQAEEMTHWAERYAEQRKGILTAINIVSDLPSAAPKWKKRKGRDSYGRLLVDEWHLEVRDAVFSKEEREIPHIVNVAISGYDHKGSWFCQWLGEGIGDKW